MRAVELVTHDDEKALFIRHFRSNRPLTTDGTTPLPLLSQLDVWTQHRPPELRVFK
jgi:hypothetical protein